VRDGVGSAVGYVASPVHYYIEDNDTRYGLTALNAIQIRASLLDAEQLISGDRYVFMRDAYLQRRDYLIKDGQVTDEFLDENWEE
jgi:phospholipid-binding lipoprotein MlaA